jgi:Rieske 2Fe-2S family protein
MPANPHPSLATLLARRRPGYCLEAPFYTNREIFDADLAIIFGQHWIYVAVEPDVPEPGDCVTVEIGVNSILIVRDDDMEVRAFHNVCRHRGARLVPESKATVGNIVCGYHQWTYNLGGELIHADHVAEDFDPRCHGLKPVHLRNVAGLLFVCLAETPPADIDEMARVMTPYLAPHDLGNCKVAQQIDIIEAGNWKLTMENNRECYHCASNHPELVASLFEYGFGFSPKHVDETRRKQIDLYEQNIETLHTAWEASGLPSRLIDQLDDRVTGFRTERLPLDGAGESQTLDTRVASRKLLGGFTDAKRGGLHFWTQPNSWHHFMSDHIVTFSALPLDPERTLLRTKWLVHRDAVEGTDYDLENLTSVWRATNDQDSALVELAQSGVRSQAYVPGPYSPYTEGLVEKFADWYVGRMAAHIGR